MIKESSGDEIYINIWGKVSDIIMKSDNEYHFKPNKPILLKANVYFDKEYNLNGKIEAKVFEGLEWNLIKGVELYDDGNHNDNNSGDGIYANEITLSEEGEYQLTYSLKGVIEGKEILREAQSYFWVELFPDLIMKEVSISTNHPKQHDNLTITATIENIGEKIANNAKIRFSYPDTWGSFIIGEDTIDVEVGETATASLTWADIPSGSYNLTVEISRLLSELNYSNNKKTVKIDINS